MATGIPFPEANTVLRAPTPEDAAAGTVYDLHVHRYNDVDGNPHVISKWQFTPDELAQVVAAGGSFWFHAWGYTHPPVGIDARNPFVSASRPTEDADRLPANAYAIARSIEVVDQFMGDDDSHILTPDVGESIMLVMHELKRLRAVTSAVADQNAVEPFIVENTDGKFVASFSTELLAGFFVDEGNGCYRHRAVDGQHPDA
jgi:hypothetical protein